MFATGWGGGDCNHTKCNLNNIFHEGKGHFATGEWAFFVFSEGKIIAIIKKCNLNNMFQAPPVLTPLVGITIYINFYFLVFSQISLMSTSIFM